MLQFGHSRQLTGGDFSPDGRLLLTCSEDGSARIWDLESGRVRLTVFPASPTTEALEEHQGAAVEPRNQRPQRRPRRNRRRQPRTRPSEPLNERGLEVLGHYFQSVTSAAFSPDGRTFATSSQDGKVHLWDATTGEQRWQLKIEGSALTVDFSPDGQTVAVGGNKGSVFLFKATNGQLKTTLTHGESNLSVHYRNDGKLVTFGLDPHVVVWDPLAGTELKRYKGPGFLVTSAAFSPDNQRLAVGALGGMMLYEGDSGRRLPVGAVEGLAFSADGSRLYVNSGQQLRILDGGSGQEVSQFPRDAVSRGLILSPGGDLIATGTRSHDILLWTTADRRLAKTFVGRDGGHFSPVSFSADGAYLATASGSLASLWELNSGRPLLIAEHRSPVLALAVARTGTLAVGLQDGTVSLYDEGVLRLSIPPDPNRPALHRAVRTMAFTPDGQHLLVGVHRSVLEVDPASGRTVSTFNGHDQDLMGLEAWAGGLVSADSGGGVKRWDLSGKMIQEWKIDGPLLSVTSSPDGRVAAAGPAEVRLLSSQGVFQAALPTYLHFAGKDLCWVEGKEAVVQPAAGPAHKLLHTTPLTGLTTSPSGDLIVTSARDGVVRLWSPSGTLKASLAVQSPQEWVAFSPQGHFDGSSEGQRHLEWRIGDRLFALEQFFNDYYTPGLLTRLAGGLPAPGSSLQRVKAPPRVEILSPKQGETLNSPTTTVRVALRDQGGGVANPSLYLNGSRVPSTWLKQNRGNEAVFEVRLLSGVNELQAAATNHDGSVSSRRDRVRFRCRAESAAPSLYLLAVGVDKYQAGLSLNFARADATAIKDFFKPGLFAAVHPVALTDDKATRATVLQALNELKTKTAPQDTVIIYLAGHGTTLGDLFYFMPHDVRVDDPESLRRTGISSVELGEALAEIPATKQLLILDACHSGAIRKVLGELVGMRDAMTRVRAQQRLARASGVFLIAASTAEQFAVEFPELGHGLLTHVILQGLGQGAAADDQGYVTATSLLQYISVTVPKLSRKYQNQEQIPVQFSTGQDFPLLAR